MVKVNFSEKVFKCPYCPQSREYSYEELYKHASRISRESKSVGLKEKAKHMALLEFLKRAIKPSEPILKCCKRMPTRKSKGLSLTMNRAKISQKKSDDRMLKLGDDQKEANEQLNKIRIQCEKKNKLDLEEREKELKNELENLEQMKANDIMLKLAEDHKKEKEKLDYKIMELQRKVDGKQRLELEIKQTKATMEVMKYISAEDLEAKKTSESIQQDLQEKEKELESLEDFHQALTLNQRLSNEELQDARQEIIFGLEDDPVHACNATIGVKRMGELNSKSFMVAGKRRRLSEQELIKFLSLREDRVMDPTWHPFKVVEGKKEIVDEEDEKIVSLKGECDEDVYNAVVTALCLLL
ncbi:hypothetical protein LXL04_017815 [Taraxacum kok-saghyz]